MDLHAVLIVIHATAATVALLIGIPALRFPRLVALHLTALLIMTLTLGGAVIIDLVTEAPGRWVFVGLLVLAVGMCLSSARAAAAMPRNPAAGTNALGFTLISLVTGFVAVSVIGAGWPVVLTVATIAAPILVGRVLVDRLVRARSRTLALA